MNLDLDFEIKASGIILEGFDFTTEDAVAQQAVQSAVRRASTKVFALVEARREARRQFGSHRNIARARALAMWGCWDFPLERAENALAEAVSALDEMAERNPAMEVLNSEGVGRPFAEWREAFTWWAWIAHSVSVN